MAVRMAGAPAVVETGPQAGGGEVATHPGGTGPRHHEPADHEQQGPQDIGGLGTVETGPGSSSASATWVRRTARCRPTSLASVSVCMPSRKSRRAPRTNEAMRSRARCRSDGGRPADLVNARRDHRCASRWRWAGRRDASCACSAARRRLSIIINAASMIRVRCRSSPSVTVFRTPGSRPGVDRGIT
jgi:hypothetical protein